MLTKQTIAGWLFLTISLTGTAQAACLLHYERLACPGKEAESFKKCAGQATCDETIPGANTLDTCAAAALQACDNDRLEITRYKKMTADLDGHPLIGGFDATGKADTAGHYFCAADRPDMNKCR
ncbi:MAG: hypothetical protein HQL87_13585 [Magnetococcales bacterium]|nr:hypothetical protein [Magnetococcales bacterium]